MMGGDDVLSSKVADLGAFYKYLVKVSYYVTLWEETVYCH